MKLKAVLETLDGVDEAVKPFYTEKDGSFYLNVEGVAEHPEAKGVKTALDKERNKNKDLQARLDAMPTLPADFDLDEYNRLKDGGSGNIDQKLADQRARLTADKDSALKKVTDERDQYKTMVTRMATENAINAALVENNITIPAHQKAVRAMFATQSKVDFENDAPVVTIDNLPVKEKITAYAASDEGKYFVTANNNGGGGSGGNTGAGAVGYDKMTFTDLIDKANKGDTGAKSELDRRNKSEKKS